MLRLWNQPYVFDCKNSAAFYHFGSNSFHHLLQNSSSMGHVNGSTVVICGKCYKANVLYYLSTPLESYLTVIGALEHE